MLIKGSAFHNILTKQGDLFLIEPASIYFPCEVDAMRIIENFAIIIVRTREVVLKAKSTCMQSTQYLHMFSLCDNERDTSIYKNIFTCMFSTLCKTSVISD